MSETLEDRANLTQRRGVRSAIKTSGAAYRLAVAAGATDVANRIQARMTKQNRTLLKLSAKGAGPLRSRRNAAAAASLTSAGVSQQGLRNAGLIPSVTLRPQAKNRNQRIARYSGVTTLRKTKAEITASQKRGQAIARKTKKTLASNAKRASNKISKAVKKAVNAAGASAYGPQMPADFGAKAPKKKKNSATKQSKAPKV